MVKKNTQNSIEVGIRGEWGQFRKSPLNRSKKIPKISLTGMLIINQENINFKISMLRYVYTRRVGLRYVLTLRASSA